MRHILSIIIFFMISCSTKHVIYIDCGLDATTAPYNVKHTYGYDTCWTYFSDSLRAWVTCK